MADNSKCKECERFDESLIPSIVKRYTPDETKQIGKAFEGGNGSALAVAWNTVFKKEIQTCYYKMSHLTDEQLRDGGMMIARLSGQIKILERMLSIPNMFVDNMTAIEKLEKEGKELEE